MRIVLFLLLTTSAVVKAAGAAQNGGATTAAASEAEGNSSCFTQPNQSKTAAANDDGAMDEASSVNNTLGDGVVHMLDRDNFRSVIGNSSFAFVLFFDPHEIMAHSTTTTATTTTTTTSEAHRKGIILHRLALELAQMNQPQAFFLRNLKIKFAAVDMRRHAYLRRVYCRWSGAAESEAHKQYYSDWSDFDGPSIPDGVTNSSTFMAIKSQDLPVFPSQWAIFYGHNFDLLNVIDDVETIRDEKVNPVNFEHVRDWFWAQVRTEVHYVMQGPDKPRLSSGGTPQTAIDTLVHKAEKIRKKYQDGHPMTTIDWKAADEQAAEMRQKRKLVEQSNKQSNNNNNKTSSFYTVQVDADGESFFKYLLQTNPRRRNDAQLMSDLADAVDAYLEFANSYETLWDDERRAIEDDRTQYGSLLQDMDQQLRDAIASVYQDLPKKSPSSNGFALDLNEYSTNDAAFAIFTRDDVPDLEQYFEDMLFGFGRSPATLRRYLEEEAYPTDNADKVSHLPLFTRIRKYMHVREKVGQSGDNPYALFFGTLLVKFHAILADFHRRLTLNFLAHLESHPVEKEDRYGGFSAIDVIDMQDPANAALLSDYDEFERRYTAQRKPVVLSNAELTKPYTYTLDFLVEKCGFVDVSNKIRKSVEVGDTTVNGWGGLQKFSLPESLMTSKRRGKDKNGETTWDTSVSLEQFVALAERFDHLYLHDFGLKKKCSNLFWAETPYDDASQQFFRIPSVIGRFDLFQRLAKSSFEDSWPSLFIGRKGSNSKLHVDNAATGFWMYLVSGTKRWIIYDIAENPYLYRPIRENAYAADVLALNATRDIAERKLVHDYFDATYPLLSRANAGGGGYEYIQQPGDLVFIPPGCPHAVENLEDIVGLSFNFVPRAGVAEHLFKLLHEKNKFGSLELALRFLIGNPDRRSSVVNLREEDPLYTTFGDFVAQ